MQRPDRKIKHKISDEDFQEYVGGRREQRRLRRRRAMKTALRVLLCVLALVVGFTVTETLLRVSEWPLPEGSSIAAPETTAAPESGDDRTPDGPPLQSFYVPLGMLDRNEDAPKLVAQARELQATAAVMLFKDSGGYLSYRSNLMQMGLLHANEKARYRTDWTLYDLKKAGQRVIGVIHCFDDPLAAERMTEAAVLQRDTGSVPWKDAQGRRWLSPYSQAAREYLLAVIREVKAFGATDVLLEGLRFPVGNLQASVFPGEDNPHDPETRNAALRDFIEQAKEAAGDAGLFVMISVEAALDGAEDLGGDLWGCAADWLAVDVREAPWALDEGYWKSRPVIPVVGSVEEAEGLRDYIILIDEAQG